MRGREKVVGLRDIDADLPRQCFQIVEFLHKLRDEEKYENLETLTRQIRVDVAQARKYFAATHP